MVRRTRPGISRFRVRADARPGMTMEREASAPRKIHGELLPVIGQHLRAGLGEAGAVLLQACQHGRIPFTDMGTTEARDVPRAGTVLMRARALCRGACGPREPRNGDEE